MQYPRLEEADQAAQRTLRHDESGNLIHVFLSPFSISQAELHEMAVDESSSEMMLRVSREREFIRELLEPLAESDTSGISAEWLRKKHRPRSSDST